MCPGLATRPLGAGVRIAAEAAPTKSGGPGPWVAEARRPGVRSACPGVGSVADDRADRLALVHQVERLVDAVQRQGVGDEGRKIDVAAWLAERLAEDPDAYDIDPAHWPEGEESPPPNVTIKAVAQSTDANTAKQTVVMTQPHHMTFESMKARKPATTAPTKPNSISCRCQASAPKVEGMVTCPASASSQIASAIAAHKAPPKKNGRNAPRKNGGTFCQ